MIDSPLIEINDSAFEQLISVLTKFVEARSISLEGSHTPEMKSCRDLVADEFKKIGASVQLLEIDDAPDAVYAEFPHNNPNAPTILLYSHYDVQPVGDLSNWTSEPFKTIVRDNRIFGRGASDDKSGIITHIGALQAIFSSNLTLPCHVKIIIEGEEELGSPHASEFLEKYNDLLKADAVIIADSVHWGVNEPAITTSLRGLVDCEIVVKTLELGVHSGEYGGVVPDALMTLSRIITSLHNEDGTVAVEGLVRNQTNEIEIKSSEILEKAGAFLSLETIGTGDVISRLWTQPAISVLAINAPPIDEAINLIVPEASAKISMRIAPGQDPVAALDALEAHLTTSTPWGASIKVIRGAAASPFESQEAGKLMQAYEKGVQYAWGKIPRKIGLGGTIPLVAELKNNYPDCEILITGVGDPISRIHGPDESQDLTELKRNIIAEAYVLMAINSAYN
ncbi:MAG: M20/M25/M40 family metallo-hydrolase [Dehalococcoidia bacterium]|nr:M20/M25/M40 family metallo-hydrolase [Dehalococcoidia bacterium]